MILSLIGLCYNNFQFSVMKFKIILKNISAE